MIDKRITEEDLENKMRLYDRQGLGFIEQTEFKNVLAELGISLTLSELIKIVKIFPIDTKNHISYLALLEKLQDADAQTRAPISEQEFIRMVQSKLLSQRPFPINLPISVRKLTSELQSSLFKDEEESHLQAFVQKLDVNGNGEISEEDLNAYKEKIRKNSKESRNPICKVDLDNLIIKIRENSIKKKVSFYDIFNKLDTNRDGFITLDEWMDTIGQIITIS